VVPNDGNATAGDVIVAMPEVEEVVKPLEDWENRELEADEEKIEAAVDALEAWVEEEKSEGTVGGVTFVLVEATELVGPVIPAAVPVEDGVEPNEKRVGFGSFETVAFNEADWAAADEAVAKAKEGAEEVVELAELAVGKEKKGVKEALAAEAVLPKDRPVAKLKEADEEAWVDAEEFVLVPNKGEEKKEGVAVVEVVDKVEVGVVEPKRDGAGVVPKKGDEEGVDEPKRDVADAEPKGGVEAVVLLVMLEMEEEEEDVFKEKVELKPTEGEEEAVLEPKWGLEAGMVEGAAAPKRGLEADGVEAAAPKGLEAEVVDVPAPKRELAAGVVEPATPKTGLEVGVVAVGKRDWVVEEEEPKEKAGVDAAEEKPAEAAGAEPDWKEKGEAEEEDWKAKGEEEAVEEEVVEGAEEKLKLKPVDAIVREQQCGGVRWSEILGFCRRWENLFVLIITKLTLESLFFYLN
jgi:hypothetical protein